MAEYEVMWLNTAQKYPVGIVKVYDKIEERYKFYIGQGYGIDPEVDVQEIIDWGQKFYNLDFLIDFIKGGNEND